MIEVEKLYNALGHNVRIVDNDGNEHEGTADLFESKYDSGYEVAIIGITNGQYYLQDDIKSIEITD